MTSIFAGLISWGLIDYLVEGILMVVLRFVAAIDTLLIHSFELVVEWVVFAIRKHVELQSPLFRWPVLLVLGLYLFMGPADEACQFMLLVFWGLLRKETVVLFFIFEDVLLHLLTLSRNEIIVHLLNIQLGLQSPGRYLILAAQLFINLLVAHFYFPPRHLFASIVALNWHQIATLPIGLQNSAIGFVWFKEIVRAGLGASLFVLGH